MLEKKEELERLKKEEEEALEYYNKIQNVSADSKKEFTSALSIPLREVASVIQMNKKKPEYDDEFKKNKSLYKKAKAYLEENEDEFLDIEESHHFPKTEVSEAKLKIVLEALKNKVKKERQ